MANVAILGAGITGLSCAMRLSEAGHNVTVLEKNNNVGGFAASFKYKDFILDYGPHKIFTLMPEIQKEILGLLGENALSLQKKSKIHLFGRFFSYPVKFAEVFSNMGLWKCTQCMLSYALAKLNPRATDDDYESYLINRFGKKIYSLLFESYAKKVWGLPSQLSSELAKTRIVVPNLISIITNTIFKTKLLSSDTIYYPKFGFGMVAERIADRIRKNNGTIILCAKITSIKQDAGKITEINYIHDNVASIIKPDFIISTIPINKLPLLLEMPDDAAKSAKEIQYQDMAIIYLFVNKNKVMDENWVFFPEARFVFNRVSELKNFSRFIAPKDKTVLVLEVTNPEIINESDDGITEACLSDFLKLGLLSRVDIYDTLFLRAKGAYPVYKKGFDANLNKITAYLDSLGNFISTGRQGMFSYNNIDHCMDLGFKAADCVINNKSWKQVREGISYQIID
ncbi:MAG TPA: FAD-dependent oxidoreductase [Nanoarchaeota archaeon]|nr:FAD-dependent oxidoreductase [Nanoarchaeota archaeon]